MCDCCLLMKVIGKVWFFVFFLVCLFGGLCWIFMEVRSLYYWLFVFYFFCWSCCWLVVFILVKVYFFVCVLVIEIVMFVCDVCFIWDLVELSIMWFYVSWSVCFVCMYVEYNFELMCFMILEFVMFMVFCCVGEFFCSFLCKFYWVCFIL